MGYEAATSGVAATTQPDAVLLTLRLFVSFVPAVIVLASMIIAYRYPITETVHREILKKLGRDPESLSAKKLATIEMSG